MRTSTVFNKERQVVGIGYMTAVVSVELRDNKFLGYIVNKDEWIVATHTAEDKEWSNGNYFFGRTEVENYIRDNDMLITTGWNDAYIAVFEFYEALQNDMIEAM